MKLDFLAIDKESSEAVSEQIARAFRGGILCGDLAFGEAVPSWMKALWISRGNLLQW